MASLPEGPEFVVVIRSLQYSTFVDLCASTILIYDYVITFKDEQELIWPMSLKSPAKVLFMLTRYLPFIDMAICMSLHFGYRFTAETCRLNAITMGWFITTGLMLSEIILTLRTWAVWQRSRATGIGLLIWFIIIWVPSFVITGIFLKSLEYTSLPPQIRGCLAIDGDPIDFVDWILLMIYESGILVLMVIKAIQNFKIHGRSLLYKAVYHDGSLFYVYLFALSALNIVCILTFPDGMKQLLTNFERVIHSVLTARILLSIRKLARRSGTGAKVLVTCPSYMELHEFDTAAIPSVSLPRSDNHPGRPFRDHSHFRGLIHLDQQNRILFPNKIFR